METKRQDIRTLSVKHARLETLINRVNCATLEAEHRRQEKHKAVGVDKVTKEQYDENLEENLKNLVERMKKIFIQTAAGAQSDDIESKWQNASIGDTELRRQTGAGSHGKYTERSI